MRLLAVSDMHGDLAAVKSLVLELNPDALICCGDWGDPGQLQSPDCAWVVEHVHTLSVFGNHDDIDLLSSLTNADGSPVLLANGEIRKLADIAVTGISGIWAKSNRLPYYITDEQIVAAAEKARAVDILVTHGTPVGLADLLPGGRHTGHTAFLEAFKRLHAHVHLCGHIHEQQISRLKDGRVVANVGHSAKGDYALVEVENGEWRVTTGSKSAE